MNKKNLISALIISMISVSTIFAADANIDTKTNDSAATAPKKPVDTNSVDTTPNPNTTDKTTDAKKVVQ